MDNNRRSILEKRSNLLRQIRAFFYAQNVIEVDTPILSQAATPDVHLRSLKTEVQVPGERDLQSFYLHTSPEYPMKRLLAEGSGDIFYLGKVFRDGDLSPRHQVEFSMLEWYRLAFSMQQLIDEVILLIEAVMPQPLNTEQITYQQAFQKYAQISDVFTASSAEFQSCLQNHNVAEIVGVDDSDSQLWEQLVLTEVIEHQLGNNVLTVMTHYPARDAALAKISEVNALEAERFEVFVNGMELANGYHELTDPVLYQQRFQESLQKREQSNLPKVPVDNNLIDTLQLKPLPDCSGVALGVDRLFMLQQRFDNIEQGIAFGLHDA